MMSNQWIWYVFCPLINPNSPVACLGLSVNMMRPNPVISSSPFSPWKLQCYGHTAVSDTRKYHIKLVIYISIYIYISQLYPIYSNLIIPLYGSRHLFPTCISHHLAPCGAGTTERQHADSTTHSEAVMFAAEVVCFGVQSGLGVQSGSMGGLTII